MSCETSAHGSALIGPLRLQPNTFTAPWSMTALGACAAGTDADVALDGAPVAIPVVTSGRSGSVEVRQQRLDEQERPAGARGLPHVRRHHHLLEVGQDPVLRNLGDTEVFGERPLAGEVAPRWRCPSASGSAMPRNCCAVCSTGTRGGVNPNHWSSLRFGSSATMRATLASGGRPGERETQVAPSLLRHECRWAAPRPAPGSCRRAGARPTAVSATARSGTRPRSS